MATGDWKVLKIPQ